MSSRQLPDTELVEPFRAPPIDAESLSAEELVRWAAEEHGDKLCLTCSWQKQSSVLVHMVSELEIEVDVIELDTQLFFRESYETRDALVERYGLKLVQPHVISVAEQHRQEGPNLWERDPDRCCHIRKVEPLVSALEPYDAWLAGIRREQSPSRADTPKLQWSERYGVWKVNPLARLGREARLGLHRGQRDSVQPAPRSRLPLHRVHPVYAADGARRGRARRTLDRLRQARVRHPRRHPSGREPCGRATPPPQGAQLTDHIYAHEHPESDRKRDGGFTLWFTGLSGSGKTTIAHLVGPELERRGHVVEYLDGDTVRTNLSKGLGFSKEDRDTNIERIGWVAARLTRHGAAVIAAAISPYEETRQKARDLVEEWGTFVEVHIATSVEECARRDVKGLYEKAFAGEIKGFTGVDDPYEEPKNPEIKVETEEHDPDESARIIVDKLEQLGLVQNAQVTA